MALTQDNLNFTISIKSFLRMLLNDPNCVAELQAAIEEGPAALGTPLGSTSVAAADEKGAPLNWYSLFIGTTQGAVPGQAGFISRTQKGDRIVARLRRQDKGHEVAKESQQLKEDDYGTALLSSLIAKINDGDLEAAKQAQILLDTIYNNQTSSEV